MEFEENERKKEMTNELTQKQITSPVAARIGEMQNEGLMIAQNYSVSNALKIVSTMHSLTW